MDHHWLSRRVVLIRFIDEIPNLILRGDAEILHLNMIIGKLVRNILSIVELGTIDDGFDSLVSIDLDHGRIGPPGCGYFVRHDPGERFGPMGLALSGPVPGSDAPRRHESDFTLTLQKIRRRKPLSLAKKRTN